MVKRFSAFLAALLISSQAVADVLTIREDAPANYVVKKGDTLWDISEIYLEDAWKWPELWRLNPQIENPHLIYPGDTISLIYDADGVPMLVINRNMKKLSPVQRKVHKKDLAVPTLPLNMIRPFLSFEQSIDEVVVSELPYILGADESHKNIVMDRTVYVNGDLEVGRQYAIYREGEPYFDYQSDVELGREAIFVGTLRAFRSGNIDKNIPASATVTSVRKEIKPGDKLLPASDGQTLPAFFSMRSPESNVEGRIIASTSKLREFSKMDVVVLNLGEAQDMKAGHMLDIVRQSPQVIKTLNGPKYAEDSSKFDKLLAETKKPLKMVLEDTKEDIVIMPREKVGELMVFKVYEKIAYAMVMDTYRPVRVGDKVITP
ncbi:LysM peptidoglycan-binding domain-containing protein [Flocculibacter collagenilyticus]|uniref:LysM peptidoglycan-binding domain-containing protein n=1 Tax=Flocculibacter collagenilyticus TaxID=2744479 RepID=UPI0018F73AB3|nr:LysM domain-containing protein [Flocculibacter collagenilyticus]